MGVKGQREALSQRAYEGALTILTPIPGARKVRTGVWPCRNYIGRLLEIIFAVNKGECVDLNS